METWLESAVRWRLDLKWTDVDFENERVTVCRSLTRYRKGGWELEDPKTAHQKKKSRGTNPGKPLNTGTPGRNRTYDKRIRSPLLYPLSYRRSCNYINLNEPK